MRRWTRDNSLSLFFLAIFVLAVVGQSIAGWKLYNEDALQHGSDTYSYGRYLLSSHFGQALLENWQSEYLQFAVFAYATIYLVQRGSNESKPLDDIGRESDQKQRVGPFSALRRLAGPASTAAFAAGSTRTRSCSSWG